MVLKFVGINSCCKLRDLIRGSCKQKTDTSNNGAKR
jgi:hypothetical protein